MTYRHWLALIALFLVSAGCDQLTKLWVAHDLELQWRAFRIGFYENHGAILGFLSDLPPLLKMTGTIVGGAFLTLLFAVIQILIPAKVFRFRVGLIFFSAGIISNFLDKFLNGFTTDILAYTTSSNTTLAINVADIFQWLGVGIMAAYMVSNRSAIFFKDDRRKHLWVLPQFQLGLCFRILFVGLSSTAIVVVFSYTFMNFLLQEQIPNTDSLPALKADYLKAYITVVVIIMMGLSSILFFVGLIISHRIAGPLYALDRFLRNEKLTKESIFTLRKNDEFKQIEDSLNQYILNRNNQK